MQLGIVYLTSKPGPGPMLAHSGGATQWAHSIGQEGHGANLPPAPPPCAVPEGGAGIDVMPSKAGHLGGAALRMRSWLEGVGARGPRALWPAKRDAPGALLCMVLNYSSDIHTLACDASTPPRGVTYCAPLPAALARE